MYAIILDDNYYLKSYSNKFRTPGSFLVDHIPNESDPDKMRCYQYIDETFVFDADKWAGIEAERAENARIEGIKQEISTLKAQIQSTDYQIIKCYEYSLIDLELPYDAEALHAERQALRDQINELEKQLNA